MSNIEKLIGIMATLRDPERGCPWDLEQGFDTIVPHTLEEAYEVAETIETGDMGALCGELGDLLFQVVFYARLAEEKGLFDFSQVVEEISDKLVRRHPHVFGDETVADAEAQTLAWEAQKADERAERSTNKSVSVLSGVAMSLPALTRSVKLQKRAARVGFDWPEITPIFDKVREELDEVYEEMQKDISVAANKRRLEEEMGDLIFACTNLARYADINPESALRRCNRKFEKRFAHMEMLVAQKGLSLEALDLGTWDQLWEQAKSEEDI